MGVGRTIHQVADHDRALILFRLGEEVFRVSHLASWRNVWSRAKAAAAAGPTQSERRPTIRVGLALFVVDVRDERTARTEEKPRDGEESRKPKRSSQQT